MKFRPIFGLGALLVFPAVALFAGTGETHTYTASSQSDETKEDIGDIHPEGTGSILSRFRATASMRGEYTSNARLSGNHGSSDFLYLPTMEVGFNQPFGHGISLDISTRAETVVYASNHDRGFWGFSGAATLDYRYRTNLPRIYVGVEPYRYVGFDTGDSVAEALALTTGVDHDWAINKGRSLIFAGYNFTNYYASPSLDDRDTHRVILGFTHQFRPALFGQIFYSYQYTDYQTVSRHDSRNIAGLSVTYQFTQHLFTSLFVNFVDSDSSLGAASYQGVNGGLGLTYQF